jgi:hypothetical protein
MSRADTSLVTTRPATNVVQFSSVTSVPTGISRPMTRPISAS